MASSDAEITGSGNRVNITGTGNHLVVSGSRNEVVDSGSGDSLTIGGNGQGASISVRASFSQAASVIEIADSRVDLLGDQLQVTMAPGDTLGIFGQREAVKLASSDDIVWIGGNGQGAQVASQITLTLGGVVHVADDANVSVTGPGGIIHVGANDTLAVSGIANVVIASGVGDSIAIGGNGTNAIVADTVTLQHGGTVHVDDNSRVDVIGSNAAIYAGTDDTLGLAGSAIAATVTGSGTTVWIGGNGTNAAMADTVTLQRGGTVHAADNARVDAIGSNLTVYAGAADTLGLSGSAISATVAGTGSTAWVGGNGTNAAVADTVTLQHGGTVHVADNSRVDVIGSNAAVFAGKADTLGLSGSGIAATVTGTGTTVWVGGNGTNAAVADKVTLQHGGTVHVAGNSRVDVIGAGASVIVGTSDTIGLGGSHDSLQFGTSIGHTEIWGLDPTDQIALARSSFGSQPTGFDYGTYLLNHAAVSGGDTTITLDANDSIILHGFALTSANLSQLFHFI